MDLRERVVAAVDAGMTQRQAAERFGVSLRTVERYLARRRAPGGPGGGPPRRRRGTTAARAREPSRGGGAHGWLDGSVGRGAGGAGGGAGAGFGRRRGGAGVAGIDV